MEEIILGGGCFWCIEAILNRIEGVINTVSGYSGGLIENPTYEEVSAGNTGHIEVVKIVFDPKIVWLKDLLKIFFLAHDPTSIDKQGADIGGQYRSVIFCMNEKQLHEVKEYIKKVQLNYKDKIVTKVSMLETFYPAEEYNQKYYEKNTNAGYCLLVIDPKMKKLSKRMD